MFRYIRLALIGAVALCTTTYPILAAEVTMRLRGSELTFTAKIINFDGKTYKVETELFGKANLDARRFECVSDSCPTAVKRSVTTAETDFGVYGSSAIGSKLMPALVNAYAKSVDLTTKVNTSDSTEANIELINQSGAKVAKIDLKTRGSGTAFPALAGGKAQIGMSSRPINDTEAALLPGFRKHVLALDGLLAIVSPQNPISTISLPQLAKVFSGQISDWSQLGQNPGPINVYARDVGSGAVDMFKSLVLDHSNLQITPQAKRFESSAELSDAVANDPQGIGFTGFAYKRNAKPLVLSTECGISYPPDIFHIKANEYPLTRRLLLYTTSAPRSKHANGILKYALSKSTQEIISNTGFINQSVEYLAFKRQGNRILGALDTSGDSFDLKLMQQLIKEIGRSSRMSMTLRFRSGSFEPDTSSQRDIKRLAALLSSAELRDNEIILLGFSDSVGAFDHNRELSRIRASQVKQLLLNAGGGRIKETRLKVRAFGELLPVGCNSEPFGRAKNRRVEVWVRDAPKLSRQQPPPQKKKQVKSEVDSGPDEQLFSAILQRLKPDLSLSEEEKKQMFNDFVKWRNRQKR